MALYYKNKEIIAIYYGEKVVNAIYKKGKLVWEAIRSCFGKGWWVNTFYWSNEDSWKNNY